MTGPYILLADLDPVSANNIASIVKEMGCRTSIVDDLNGVINACKKRDVGMLILDTSILALEGFGVIQVIRRLRRELPIIITTGTPSEEIERDIRSCGIIYYAPKPVDFYWIKEIIRRSFTRDSLFRSSR